MIKIDMINFEPLPFFGKCNSIKSIGIVNSDTEGKSYLVKRYDDKGKEKKENFYVPMKLRAVRDLMEDYCNDVGDYLAKNESKYIECKKAKKIFNLDISLDKLKNYEKISKVGICLGALLIGATFSIISIPVVFYTGMIVLLTSSVGMVVLNDISKEIEQSKFLKDYDLFSRKFNENRSYLDKNKLSERTRYNGLSNSKNEGNNLKLRKIKTL